MSNDTIAAVATPAGTGGIAMVRLSGPQAVAIVQPCIAVAISEPRKAVLSTFATGEGVIDEVVVTFYRAPHSYTGEDVVELSCHGSLYVQQAILGHLISLGARLAEPGEFTRRAFVNGKLDLSQAEAVADLIDAATPAQHRLAVSQLRGGYARELAGLRQRLIDLTSLLELELDFSQEDVAFADRGELLATARELATSVNSLLDSFALGNALKQGVPVAITGSPNVGKSSLLNALLHDDRAIVSPIPGTTRDCVEGLLTVGGITFRLIDTAGLRDTADEVERLGIERSHRVCNEAMIVLHVADSTGNIQPTEPPHDGRRHLLVLNKCDLGTLPVPPAYEGSAVSVSALTGYGIEELKQLMASAVSSESVGNALLTNVRHRDALLRVSRALNAVAEGLAAEVPADLVAIDLRDALHHLGTVTGEVTTDEVLGNIFSRFCVGK